MEVLGATAVAVLTRDDAKRAMDILPDETDRDALVDDLLAAAVAVVDRATAHPAVSADHRFSLPPVAFSRWWFPVRPVTALGAVEVQDAGGVWSAASGTARIEAGADAPRFVPDATLQMEIAGAVAARVTATCGGGITQQHRQATILILREWMRAGISDAPSDPPEMTFAARNLINQVRWRRPVDIA